ncbi:hypothetical protein MY04_05845 (plasmid) [Flammeovirga sp. MY04]|uniref:hypothetical protein n=1 Tax=Flammeovirga sp. MY04 TaxID=1191459 RepID=UPI0008060BA2|nr:hypothetical protein [Flammeovirga sp. MY04]ANQ52901.1 hypothetical protein MY04_05845 [Flammeovirga sp. MY04]
MRTIKTARTLEEINQGVKDGFKTLFQEVKPSPKIKRKVAVVWNDSENKYQEVGDFRSGGSKFYWYYPYHFPNPYAAYLLPKDLEIGERVFLEDVIEDIVASEWNQGDTTRLEAGEATWNGESFDFDERELIMIMG